MINRATRLHYGWFVVAAALVTLILSNGMRFSFGIFYLPLLDEFQSGNAATASIGSLNTLVYAVSSPLAGAMVDRLAPRSTLLLGALLLGAGLALSGAASSLWQVFVLYGIVVALGNSLTGMTPNIAVVSRWFDRRSRSVAIGVLNSGFSLALVVSLLAQQLVSQLGWRLAYLTLGLLAVAIIMPAQLVIGRRPPQYDDPIATGDGIWQAASTRQTLMAVLRNQRFWLLGLIFFSTFGIFCGILYTLQVAYAVSRGFDPRLAAFVFTVFGILQAVGNWLAGLSIGRLGYEVSGTIGLALIGLGMGALLLLSNAPELWLLYTWAVLAGLGLGVVMVLNNAAVALVFGGKNFGLIFGLVTAFYGLGGAVGPSLGGLIVDHTGNYTITFLVALAFLTISTVAMWVLAPRKM